MARLTPPPLLLALLAWALSSCGDAEGPAAGGDPPDGDAVREAESAPDSRLIAGRDLASDPAAFRKALAEGFGRQIELIHADDVEALRAFFTPRLRDRLTPELLASSKGELEGVDMAELLDRIEIEGEGASLSAKILMKNGRTLTTCVLDEGSGRWLADTLWFR